MKKMLNRRDLLATNNWSLMIEKAAEHMWVNTIGKHDHVGMKMGEIMQSASFPGEPTRFILEFQVIPKIPEELLNFEGSDIVGEIFRTIFRGMEHIAVDIDLIVKQHQKKLEYEQHMKRMER